MADNIGTKVGKSTSKEFKSIVKENENAINEENFKRLGSTSTLRDYPFKGMPDAEINVQTSPDNRKHSNLNQKKSSQKIFLIKNS